MAEEEPEFDFGSKKKSKKSKKEKKEADDDAGEGAVVGVDEWQRGEEYTYDFLLSRLYEIIEAKNPSLGTTKKYVMKPPQIVRVGSKKVGWVNFTEICNMMNRSTEHVMGFVLAEFGTEGNMAGEGQLILKGRYLPKHLESLLRKYIKEFVTCEMCKSANTALSRDSSTRLHVVSCGNCGASRTATNIKAGYHATTRADRKAAKNKE
eukprot:TRINITY_DN16560_c0_g1_i2.p1 TRINITY_DN16560_c0_g1~~TRINITY_DN16560_c0_g1_i2.p1  ORF type:complete len:207 (-),score=70.23 TRINITY_DN16560_c0_g1_i2:58-678(-)